MFDKSRASLQKPRSWQSFVRPKHRQDAIARVQSQAQKIQDTGRVFFLVENNTKKSVSWVNFSEILVGFPKIAKMDYSPRIWWVKDWTPD